MRCITIWLTSRTLASNACWSEHPTAYASRTLSNAERNYSNLEREALSLVFGGKKFPPYIYGRHFSLVTDHKPLESLCDEKRATQPMAAARIQRWALTLAAYNYMQMLMPSAGYLHRLALLPHRCSQKLVCDGTPQFKANSQ